jgi:hypothetical protein
MIIIRGLLILSQQSIKMYELTLTHFCVATVVVLGIYKLLQIGKRDSRMPPGPPTLPILGNLHQVPITGLYKQYVLPLPLALHPLNE